MYDKSRLVPLEASAQRVAELPLPVTRTGEGYRRELVTILTMSFADSGRANTDCSLDFPGCDLYWTCAAFMNVRFLPKRKKDLAEKH